MSITQSIELTRGEDRVIRATMDKPRDISVWTIEFVVCTSLNGAVALRYSTALSPGGITKTNAQRGVIEVAIPLDDSLTLSENSTLDDGYGYVWHIKRVDAGSNKELARGELIVNERVAA